MDTTLYVTLGRNGDVLAALPIIQHELREGRKACVMVSAEYAPLLDGVSLDRIVWQGDWRHVRAAHVWAMRDWPNIVVLQQYNTDGWPVSTRADSFVKEMYRIVGKLSLFPLPLVFDRRDPERESALLSIVPTDKPLMLVATRGISSPFAHGEALIALLTRTFPHVRVLDMGTVRAERLFDLLALFERAACLVTIDSALLHLAQAVPTLPVIALVTDRPTTWHGSPRYAGQVLRVPYSAYPRCAPDILAAVAACLFPAPALGQ